MVGQDLDNLEGGMNPQQSIHGDVADYQLYQTALDPQYLKEFARCGSPKTSSKPILSFDNMLEIRGDVVTSQVALQDLCQPEESNSLYMLPEKRDFQASRDACARMKGWMAVPPNDEVNKKVFDQFVRFNDDCVEAYGTLYWLGIKGDLTSRQWINLKEKAVPSWDNLAPGYDQVQEDASCATVGGLDFPRIWYSTPCEYAMCSVCNFTARPSFRVRGLCKDSFVDRSLFLSGYENRKPHFQGPYYISVFWNEENKTWSMTSRGEENLIVHMLADVPDPYPMGINTWTFQGDDCGVNTVRS